VEQIHNSPVGPVQRVILIGLMGAGKSSIGRRLSKELDLPLIDLDDVIVEKAGMSIPEIFEQQGEAAFRRMESETLREAVEQPAIIATGGGIVMAEENRALLKQHPPVVWLQASPEFLAARIDGDSNRPLIAVGNTLNRLKSLAELRYPLYEACADLVVPREFLKKKEVVQIILRFLASRKQP